MTGLGLQGLPRPVTVVAGGGGGALAAAHVRDGYALVRREFTPDAHEARAVAGRGPRLPIARTAPPSRREQPGTAFTAVATGLLTGAPAPYGHGGLEAAPPAAAAGAVRLSEAGPQSGAPAPTVSPRGAGPAPSRTGPVPPRRRVACGPRGTAAHAPAAGGPGLRRDDGRLAAPTVAPGAARAVPGTRAGR